MRQFRIAAVCASLSLFLIVAGGCKSGVAVGSGGPSALPDSRQSPIADRLVQPKQDEHAAAVPEATETRSRPKADPEKVRGDGSKTWAVIAATYKSFAAAENRATRLKAAYGDCACVVYPREGEGQNYYVMVASNLTREAADARREQAVSAGLPDDTYVTKLLGPATREE
jgi:hypothetical protein